MSGTPRYVQAIEMMVKQLAHLEYTVSRNSGMPQSVARTVAERSAERTLIALRGPMDDSDASRRVTDLVHEIGAELDARQHEHEKGSLKSDGASE